MNHCKDAKQGSLIQFIGPEWKDSERGVVCYTQERWQSHTSYNTAGFIPWDEPVVVLEVNQFHMLVLSPTLGPAILYGTRRFKVLAQ